MSHPRHQTACRRFAAVIFASLVVGIAPGISAQPADPEPAAPVPEVWRTLTAALAPSIDVTHHQVDVRDDQLTATSVRFAAADLEASRGALTVGRLQVFGLPDPSAPDVIAGRLVMHDVLYRPGGSGVGRVERLTIEGASGLAAFLQALVLLPDPEAETTDDATAGEDADPAPADDTLGTLLSALQALQMQSLVVEGVTTVERRGRSRQQTLALDRLSLGPVDAGVIEALTLDGLAITDRSQVNVERLAFRAMNVAHWLTLAVGTETEMVPLALILDPGIEAMSIVGIEMFDQDGASLLALAGGDFETLGDDPDLAGASFAVDRLAFPVSTIDDVDAETALRDLGYLDIEASFALTLQLDRSAEALTLGPIRLSLADMATIEIMLTLGRFDLETLIGQLETMARTGIPQLPPTTLEAASFVLTDASLTNRLIQRAASVLGVTPDEVVAEALGEATAIADDWQLEEPHRSVFLDAIDGFLREPGTFAIAAQPDRPVTLLEAGLGAVAGPGTLFERLNVAITTE